VNGAAHARARSVCRRYGIPTLFVAAPLTAAACVNIAEPHDLAIDGIAHILTGAVGVHARPRAATRRAAGFSTR
jgi:hypothetical protein